jgi:FeoB-associated Cys-rich membrane protein
MDLQLGLVLLIVTVAVGYLGYAGYRTVRSSKAGCGGGGCACARSSGAAQSAPGNGLIPPAQLTLRRRDNP